MKYINTKMRYNKTICLETEMDEFMKYIGLDEKMKELKILELWDECVGEVIAKYSTPVRINKNKLMVSVENAVWRYELASKKKEILEKLNKKIRESQKRIIKDIIFI
jgi:predicted nucleic acid-binding Zn ribbon protein